MKKSLACLLLAVSLAGCGTGSTPAPVLAVPSLTATVTATPTLLPVLTEFQLPTATPIVHTIVEGDTLIGIAGRYGISVETLQAANPGVQPETLIPGQELVIPTGNQVPGEPSPTPVAFTIRQARCWAESGGGLWCFALIENEFADTLENLSAQFTLVDQDDRALSSLVGYGLIDILPPGRSMPLAVHFPAPQPAEVRVRVQILTGNRLLPGDSRYLGAQPLNTLVTLDDSSLTASVSGQVVLAQAGPSSLLWVLASAYDSGGNVIGVRRWESPSALNGQTPLSFQFQLSSVGPAIARVEFLVEARP